MATTITTASPAPPTPHGVVTRATIFFWLVRIVVNAITITVTAWIMPGISLGNERIITLVLLGAGFGLINAFIRPIVLLLTGQFVILTMGLFTLVINAAMLWLLAILFPTHFIVDGIFTAFVGGLLMAIISTVLEILFGMTRPIDMAPLDEEVAWQRLEWLSSGRRNRIIENMRLQEVYRIFWRYGLDIAFDRSPIGGFRRWMQVRLFGLTDAKGQELSTPAKLRLMLQELGPTYVKVGQMISSRADVLPPDWRDELSRLQSSVAPFPYEQARRIIEEELGAPPEKLFTQIEQKPLAAASTAQIHRATLPDGTEVVVKVQRPDILAKVKADLGIMLDAAGAVERRAAWARNYNLRGIIGEFADNVIAELDYTNEAYNARRIAASMATIPLVHVPAIDGKRSGVRVLTMEFVRGVKIVDVAALDAAGVDREALAERFVRAMIKQLLIDGFFHGDPHPGNVLVDPQTSTIIFLDCGMVGNLTGEKRMQLMDLIFSLMQVDTRELAGIFLSLSMRFKEVDEAAFMRDLERLLGRYLLYAEAQPDLSSVIGGTLSLMYRHGLRLDNTLTLALKTLIQAEEITTTLAPTTSLVAVAYAQVKELLAEQATLDNAVDLLKREGIRSVKQLIRRIPSLSEATVSWLDQYQSGRFIVHLDAGDLSKQMHYFSLSVKRLTVGLVLVGMLVGSAIAVRIPFGAEYAVLPLIAMGLLVGTMALSLILVLRMISDVWAQD